MKAIVAVVVVLMIGAFGWLAPSRTGSTASMQSSVLYEVWAIDQSNSPGKTFGGAIHIYDGADLENSAGASGVQAETIDLSLAASELCFERTGANPVRPHMIAMNARNSHAIISFVASGHVLIMDAPRRTPVECIRTSIGENGARQVHFAIPAPDESFIAVGNQNGKLLERIDTDYATNTFLLNAEAMLNLYECITPNGIACQASNIRPDNAPICPAIDGLSRLVYVTLRGGGMLVVDATSTPMQIVAEYDMETVNPNGCLGVQVGAKMYISSGGGTAAHLFGADVYAFPVNGFSPSNPPNIPAPRVVLHDAAEEADAHGATLTGGQRYLWIADRGRNFIWVVDTTTDEVVHRISLAGDISDDPTPDLLVTSPSGSHVFVTLRGPNPLTADPHVSMGSTPGVGIIRVSDDGQDGRWEAIVSVSNRDADGVERADMHALALRLK